MAHQLGFFIQFPIWGLHDACPTQGSPSPSFKGEQFIWGPLD